MIRFNAHLCRRPVRILAGLAGALAALGATVQAAFAQPWPHPGSGHLHAPPQVRTIVIGGMPGWQVALIAVAAAAVAGAGAVIVDRLIARRPPGPVTAGEPAPAGGDDRGSLPAVTLGPGRW
jgi:hypothetical protein